MGAGSIEITRELSIEYVKPLPSRSSRNASIGSKSPRRARVWKGVSRPDSYRTDSPACSTNFRTDCSADSAGISNVFFSAAQASVGKNPRPSTNKLALRAIRMPRLMTHSLEMARSGESTRARCCFPPPVGRNSPANCAPGRNPTGSGSPCRFAAPQLND